MENLKEMGDVSSGMASTIIQLYLKEVLKAYQHADATVRQPALKVIQLVLQQGLVHPVQVNSMIINVSSFVILLLVILDYSVPDLYEYRPGGVYIQCRRQTVG